MNAWTFSLPDPTGKAGGKTTYDYRALISVCISLLMRLGVASFSSMLSKRCNCGTT